MLIRSLLWLLFAILLFCLPGNANGQRRRLPNDDYYRGFNQFYQGDYRDAGKDFRRGGNTAYQRGDQRYLDSICYWTMQGECHYHLGQYAEAIELYERSLDLYLSYQKARWQSRVQAPPVIQADNNAINRARISWGEANRNSVIPRLPGTFSVLFGNLDSERQLHEGGVVDNANLRQVDVTEIMRCTALALHRRRTIMGPTCKYAPFSVNLVNGLSRGGAARGTLLHAYNGVLLGIAQASMDQWDKAAKSLNSALQFSGKMDHALTPIALLELADVALQTNHEEIAAKLALEASYSAAVFNQYDLIEESLRLGTKIHLLLSSTPYPPLEFSAVWAKREKARMLEASILVSLAECLAEAGKADLAAEVLRRTSGPIKSRNSLGQSVIGARLKYVGAVIHFLKGDSQTGQEALVAALQHFQSGSLWLYRLAVADRLVLSGNMGERQADLLYGVLLHDPSDRDWKLDPMESIAFLTSDHVGPMERWFDIVVSRKDMDRAINISELVRRHRYFSQLPLGGRLMAFRWVMHAPVESLTELALKQRRQFLTRHVPYKNLMDQAEQIRVELLALPLKPESGSDEAKRQLSLFEELATVSALQETMLTSIALRREPAEMVFPPQFDLSTFRKSIKSGQLAFITLETASGYHSFFVNKTSVKYVKLSRSRDVFRGVSSLLKKMGLMDSAVDIKTLQDDKWQQVAAKVAGDLFGKVPDAEWDKVKELVIVPDGVLWYLPFEVLRIGEKDKQTSLFERFDLRYSPTLFLAFAEQRPERRLTRSAVIVSKMHSRGEPELSQQAFGNLVKDLPTAIKYDRAIRIPSNLLASLFDQLVIWSEVKQNRGHAPLDMMPLQIDQGKQGTTLRAWGSLPWFGPEHVIMPGFQSDGGTAMRSKLNGRDLFMTTCSLMGSGTRTILISRWSMGGGSSLELSRNYVQRLPEMDGLQALRESIDAQKQLDLNYENEPRLRTRKSDPVLKATHPAFWSGNMLLAIPAAVDPDVPEEPKLPVELPKEIEQMLDPPAAEKEADKPPADQLKVVNPDNRPDAAEPKIEMKKKKPKSEKGDGTEKAKF